VVVEVVDGSGGRVVDVDEGDDGGAGVVVGAVPSPSGVVVDEVVGGVVVDVVEGGTRSGGTVDVGSDGMDGSGSEGSGLTSGTSSSEPGTDEAPSADASSSAAGAANETSALPSHGITITGDAESATIDGVTSTRPGTGRSTAGGSHPSDSIGSADRCCGTPTGIEDRPAPSDRGGSPASAGSACVTNRSPAISDTETSVAVTRRQRAERTCPQGTRCTLSAPILRTIHTAPLGL
jgi:hypothetical protein